MFVDETGFSLVSPLKRTWSPAGQTPVLRTSIEHFVRLNLLGALCLAPDGEQIRLRIHSHAKNLSGEEVLRFVQDLLGQITGEIVLLWDNHPIHRRKMVQEVLAECQRLHLFWFPTCAPELNPVEYVWTQVSEYLAGRAPLNRQDLTQLVRAGVARTRRSPQRMWACVHASRLLGKIR